MLRIVVQTDDASMAANVGGKVETKFRTFDIDAPELEAFLREPEGKKWQFTQRQAVGIEVIDRPADDLPY